MDYSHSDRIILGLDIGPNSIGWALMETDNRKPQEFRAIGVRVFEAGLDSIEKDGKGKSRNVDRREARGRRRLLARAGMRRKHLVHILQKAGLFPTGNFDQPDNRHEFITQLDKKMDSPYKLRARALDEKLTLPELGRVFYHLSQRRGFLSNRKSAAKKEVKERGIKGKIKGLQEKIEASGSRTLGEYLSTIDPRKERIRERYTARGMYETEFEKIWESQSRWHGCILTDTLKKEIQGALFYQRPLKSQSHLIGECELEKGRKRAPWALLDAQRFRYLQKVNDLKVVDEWGRLISELTSEQRNKLIEELENNGDLEFPKIRKLLGLPNTAKFNFERGGEEKIPGNRTAAKLIKIFGRERWSEFTDEQKNAIVDDWLSITKDETLKKRGMNQWRLEEKAAEAFGSLNLENGYCSFSRQAIAKLLPKLKNGVQLQTAIRELYPERWARDQDAKNLLPPVDSEELPDLRNPIVSRALTEVRRVVNAIINRYGVPGEIHIELGRELRQTPKQREQTWKKNRANEKERAAAAEKILKEASIENPSRNDILKVLLAEECNWECPYTGTGINLRNLVGDAPQFDIEHIIPFDRCLDDSYMNKTLCEANENRNVKKNKTPYEAYHGTNKWDEIIARAKRFKGNAAREKVRRFMMEPEEVGKILDDFTSRQLNDTRWAAKWAKKYLGLLYGGIDADGIDASGKRRVLAIPAGQVTAHLRNALDLNSILGDGPGKTRDDHRHHAVDAMVVALADQSLVKMLSDCAKRADLARRRLLDRLPPPWEGFNERVRELVDGIVISHRVSKRVRGALHEETFYGKPRKDEKGKQYVHQRIPIEKLTPKNIENIVDPIIQECVRQKLRQIGKEPKEAFKDSKNHPVIKAGDRVIPIHKVRIKEKLEQIFAVGEGTRIRYVKTDRNHHIAIYKAKDKKGNEIWDGEVVSLFEAYQRLKRKEPIVNRNLGEGKEFLFSLANGEIIELDDNKGGRKLYKIRSVPSDQPLRFVPINDARVYKPDMWKGLTAPPDSLRKRNCKKKIITPLGEVRDAND
jgi:CRISPR-associated endonuclease Csn1